MNNIYSVSQVNKYIKMVFDKDIFLNNISIRGEITNFKAHYSGHLYFTLKDELATVKCVMFKGNASLLKFTLTDGMKVTINGQISTFERDGVYQVYCKDIVQDGLGELFLAYEKLKVKLDNEGLFDEKYKKKIPFLPKCVGVITSQTGSVIKDIINVATRRYKNASLLIYPAAVQGTNVSSCVINALDTLNKLNNVDVIIIARGGGSFEDLFGFNDENLARKVFESDIPVISAVGHETDFTICDFVSDLRAPTPSAAAELVYPLYSDIVSKIMTDKNRILKATQNYIKFKKEHIKRIKAAKLEKVPLDMINKNRMIIDSLVKNIYNALNLRIEKYRSKYTQQITKLDTLSPLKTLIRGYSVVETMQKKLVTSVDQIKKDDKLNITLADGKIKAQVI
ncbi:MAG: exodeoxyribonuclease VII large subunit [Clostridia bacterium]